MGLVRNPRIVIAGAGSVGCYLGGRLHLAGRNVTFLLRPELKQALRQFGMRLGDLDAPDVTISPAALSLTDEPAAAFAQANIILVTVKSGATAAMAELIARHAPAGAMIVSLQNGVDNVGVLAATLGQGRTVVAGMVPFNILQTRPTGEPPSFRRATSGSIMISEGYEDLRELLDVPGAPVAEAADMLRLQWTKLLLNLNNALNALSGIPLAAEFADPAWRRLLSAQMQEALAILKAATIRPARFQGIHPRLIARVLCLPNGLFKLLAKRMLSIDPRARSSMWDDLEARRPTEIDHIQGKLLALADALEMPAPLNRHVLALIRQAEAAQRGSPHLSASAVAAGAEGPQTQA